MPVANRAGQGPLGGLFGDEEVARLLSPRAEIESMLRVEAALALVEARLGIIPEGAGPAIATALEGLTIDPAQLAGAARGAGVPVPGLVKILREGVGPPHGQYLHWGATSQDVMDTGLVLRLGAILEILEARLQRAIALGAEAAEVHADLAMAARTRSQLATPTTLGLRIAGWIAPLGRCLERLDQLRPRLLVVQLGGAAGTLSVFGERGVEVMEALAGELGLDCPPKPWHAERDALIELAGWLALVSGLVGRIGGDLVLLGRSEIAEVRAGEGGGSSTMPQKANPVLAETLLALARRNAAEAGTVQQALLHQEERDGAAWSLEWLTLPGMLVATAAGLAHSETLLASLRPDGEAMARALALQGGAVEAEALAFALARSLPLPEAQAIVKQAARNVAAEGGTLAARVEAISAERGLPPPVLDPGPSRETIRALIRRSLEALPRPAS